VYKNQSVILMNVLTEVYIKICIMKIKLRAINKGLKSKTAQSRRNLYKNAKNQIKNAIKHCYYLKAIAIIESMLADRMESRIAFIYSHRAFCKTSGWLWG